MCRHTCTALTAQVFFVSLRNSATSPPSRTSRARGTWTAADNQSSTVRHARAAAPSLHPTAEQWPLSLSTVLAKTVAHQMTTSLKLKAGGYTDEDLAVSRLRTNAMEALAEQCALWRAQPELAEELPLTPAASLPVSVHGVRNSRRKMEDRHLALPDLNFALGLQGLPQYSYYAVFDGHAGVEAADYATAHLHRNIAAQPDFVTDPVNAVRQGFMLTDRNFLQRSSKEGLKSGCTAVCCLVREQRQLIVGWLGDSQAVLVRKGIPMALVNPHKPEREASDERKRIEELGGVVLLMGIWRVNGTLGVSRAIGDAEHKPYVTSEPDVISVDLDGTEDFLVLGCDGLWDQLSPQEVAARVYQEVLEDPESAPYVSHTLVQGARDLGSSDNITAVVVFLRDPREFEDSSLDIVCNWRPHNASNLPEKTASSELPTPPIEDAKEGFNASEFDASKFNSNGYGAHMFNAEEVNSHAYEHANESEILQVASGVVQETIETALHTVNEDVITAGQIVDQVHLLHTEESVKFSDLPEQFHGAVPADGAVEDKFDQPDGVSHAANGYGDNVPTHQAVHHNPFDDEGYGHDLETAECLQSSAITSALEQSCTESVEQFSSFAEGDNEASSSQPELHEQTFCTAPSLTPQHHEFDDSSDQEVGDRQPSPSEPCTMPEEPQPVAADLPAEPHISREAELPDEGVDFSTLPEDVQELEAAKEQPVSPVIEDECLGTLPEDQQDFKVAQPGDTDPVVLPDATEQVATLVNPTHVAHDTAILDAEYSEDFHGSMLQPDNIHEEVQQPGNFYGDVQQSDHNKEEIQPELPSESTDVKGGTDNETATSGLAYQPLSIQSDDLVSIDLNSSAMQSLAETSVPPHAADDAFTCETAAEPVEDMSLAYHAESEDAHPNQPLCETLESLGTDDADDTSLGGSAESIVEKVTAEPIQQDSAVIFCELKETLPAESILDQQCSNEQKVDNLDYTIPVEQQVQVPAEVSDISPQVETPTLGVQASQPFVEDSFPLPTSTESSHNLEHMPEEPSLLSADTQLQAEPQQPATTAISPVNDVKEHFEQSNQHLSEDVEQQRVQSQSPVVEELLDQKSASLHEVQSISEHAKATVDTPAPVDIGAIPENIPEADGVTEDSGSEKDSEWRFVKPVEPVTSPSSELLEKEASETLTEGSRAAEETIHGEQKEETLSELVKSPAENSVPETKADAVSDIKQDLLPETESEVADTQKQTTLPEQKASTPKTAATAKPSLSAQKTKPTAKASPAPKPRTPSTDKPATKPLTTKTEASTKATPAAKSPMKKQPTAAKGATATPAKPSSSANTAAKASLSRRSEPTKPKTSSPATDSQTKKPVPASSRPTTGTTRPTSGTSKPAEKSTAPVTKAKPTAPSSSAPRARTAAGSATTSASKAEVGTAEKKPTTKPAPARAPISRPAPKPTQPASSSSSSSTARVGSSAAAGRTATAATSRPGTTSKVGSTSTATKKTSDAGPVAAKTSAARVPATRDAKLSKDSTNQQLAGTRRTETTQRSAAGRTATASKTAATKPTATSKYAAVRAVPKGGAAAAAAAAAAAKATAAANDAESKSKEESAANCNGTPEEKGTLEQKDNKEACVSESEPANLSNGTHPECDKIAKPATDADMPDAPAVDV
ncbi:hypothetical protein HPB50_024744 [Hyalomma asiaticum]|uniref:Uncharacterized protein n=1 Tax=Hyalomma asiaticum TaxID=266040 RepID=A0ACB7SL84_HYAAI|nr:hypothetical protein HPB50_024744 [Hyalomma asiaticum]